MNATSALLFFAVTATAARAQVVESWQTAVDHSPYWDFHLDSAVARDGSTTIFGLEQYEPGTLNSAGGSVVRLGPSGDVVWSRRYDVFTPGPNHTRFYAGALYEDGGCVAVAQAIELPFPTSDRHLHVVRYDASGTQLWNHVVQFALPQAITVARDGDVWVAGRKSGSSGWDDIAVWRFSAAGALLSTTQWDGPGQREDGPAAIAVDGVGGVYVAGYAGAVGQWWHRLLLRLAPDGTVLWSRIGAEIPSTATDLAVGPDSSVCIASTVQRAPSSDFGVLEKYDQAGNKLWERDLTTVGSSVYLSSHVALALDGDVVGASGRGTVRAARFDGAGVQRWSTVVTSGSVATVAGLAIDEAGNATLAGDRQPGGVDGTAYVAEVDPAGNVRWLRFLGDGSESWNTTLSVGAGPPGSTFVLGRGGNATADFALAARLDDAIVSYCAGDGSGTACPCGNAGQPGNGCANTASIAGARLAATGTASLANDSLVLAGTGMPDAAVLYFQGTTTAALGAGSVFGDGLLCVAGFIARIGMQTNVGGSSSYPGPFDPSISARGGIVGGMQSRTYQAWYRDPADFCTVDTFSLTNALIAIWVP